MTPAPGTQRSAAAGPIRPANRLGLDYVSEAERLPTLAKGIIDVHTHIHGPASAKIYRRVADLYGIRRLYSMTQLENVDAVREVFEPDRIRFIGVPNYTGEDRLHHHGRGYVDRVEKFHAKGVRIIKFWAAPRGIDYGDEVGDPGLLRLDAPLRIEAMEAATALGMMFMVHVGDPDTWFASKYTDPKRYGTKAQQYDALEELLERFTQPWIAAHLGGWPENLEHLTGLLRRHDNLYLDTSATKWMIRELSKHDRKDLVSFFETFRGRILFGSDILTDDQHLQGGEGKHESVAKAASADEAFDLYASRYWALRTMYETDYHGPSPIADPDLAMVDPNRYDEMDAPTLSGKALPDDLLASLYHDAAHDLLEPLHGSTK